MSSPSLGDGARQPPPSALPEGVRRSYALESLSGFLAARPGLHILDLGGINQANLDYITGLGHRLYAEDLIRTFDGFFTPAELAAQKFNEGRIGTFLSDVFTMPERSAHCALVWDTLQFLPPRIAEAVLDRLYRVLVADALVLAFFHPESGGAAVAAHSCRVYDPRHLLLVNRAARRPVVAYNSRSIERLFGRFQAVKFFLTRESLQEIIARR